MRYDLLRQQKFRFYRLYEGAPQYVKNLYSANLTKGSLKVAESRLIAALLLEGVDDAAWQNAIVNENVLQKRSASTAKTFAEYIRHRLSTMKPDLWELVRDGSPAVATQAVLAATLKHSLLLADFFVTMPTCA